MKSSKNIHDSKSPSLENQHRVDTSQAEPPGIRERPSTNSDPEESTSPIGQLPGDHNGSAAPLRPEPGHEEIARLAYKRFVARGQGAGQAEEDWLMAELELRAAIDLTR